MLHRNMKGCYGITNYFSKYVLNRFPLIIKEIRLADISNDVVQAHTVLIFHS